MTVYLSNLQRKTYFKPEENMLNLINSKITDNDVCYLFV